MVDSRAVVAGLSIAGILIGLSVLIALARPRTLRRQVLAVQAGKYPAWQGYARYRGVTRIGSEAYASLFLLLLVALLAFVFVLPQSSLDFGEFLAIVTTPANLAVLLICFLTGLVAAITISTVIVAVVADAPAYRLLCGGTLRTGEMVARRLKMLVPVRLPLMLACDGCIALFGFGVNWVVCLVLIIAVFVATNFVALRVMAPLLRWLYSCVPLEQTRWAAQSSRVEAWARLAGKPVPRVYVRSGPVEGFGNSAAVGGTRGILYLSDAFLARSEWRQQDALLCWLLIARAPLIRQAARIAVFGIGLQLGLVAVLVSSVLLLTNMITDASAGEFAAFLPISLLMALLVIFSIVGRGINRRARRIFGDSDRRAAELTGDPWAVMTMLATMDTLCQGIPALGERSVGAVPPRLAALEAFTRMPGPRAPWAYQPVPSLQPVLSGPYPITVPLGMQEQPEGVSVVPKG